MVGSGVLITVFWDHRNSSLHQANPFDSVIKSHGEEAWESEFEQMKAGFKGKILPPTHRDSVRVTMIAKDIIDALLRGLRKEQVWSDLGYPSERATLGVGDGRETLNALVAGGDENIVGNWYKEDEILDDQRVQQSRKKVKKKVDIWM